MVAEDFVKEDLLGCGSFPNETGGPAALCWRGIQVCPAGSMPLSFSRTFTPALRATDERLGR